MSMDTKTKERKSLSLHPSIRSVRIRPNAYGEKSPFGSQSPALLTRPAAQTGHSQTVLVNLSVHLFSLSLSMYFQQSFILIR